MLKQNRHCKNLLYCLNALFKTKKIKSTFPNTPTLKNYYLAFIFS